MEQVTIKGIIRIFAIGDAQVSVITGSSDDGSSIELPRELFESLSDQDVRLSFTAFNNASLFPLPNDGSVNSRFSVASSVIGANVAGHDVSGLDADVIIKLKIDAEVWIFWHTHTVL